MAYLIVKSIVQDHAKWKSVFDGEAERRKAAGSKGGMVLRNSQNPNDLTVLLEWDTLERARAFAESPELKTVMAEAGVVGKPEIGFFDDSSQVTV